MMKKESYLLLISLMFLVAHSAISQDQKSIDRYIYQSGDPNGIGKWYMGREIAHVMGYQGISWLERQGREREERTSKLLEFMDIKETDVIADIGAGSGYHVFKMSDLAIRGKIYGVDIQQEMIAAMQQKITAGTIDNVELVKGTLESVNLSDGLLNKVLMVDVYHEFSFPVEMMESIYSALKPDGKVFLIEYRAEDSTVPIKRLHKMSEAQALKEMNAVGFRLEENIKGLPWQHCMVFVKSDG